MKPHALSKADRNDLILRAIMAGNKSYTEIGDEFGMTKQRVEAIHHRAKVERLRELIEQPTPSASDIYDTARSLQLGSGQVSELIRNLRAQGLPARICDIEQEVRVLKRAARVRHAPELQRNSVMRQTISRSSRRFAAGARHD